MTVTYEKIATATASSSATIDFTSISGSYTDLVLVSNLQAGTAGASLFFTVNGSTTTYSCTNLSGNGTTAASTRISNTNRGLIFDIVVGLSTSLQNMAITNFMNYSNATTYKTVLSRGGNAGALTEASVSLWRNTAAITSISIFMGTGNITSGTFTLYGIKAE